MSSPALKQFDTEEELIEFVEQLLEAGMAPEVAIMDSSGVAALACRQAPGGDGWGFAYYGVNDEDGTIRNTSGHDELNALATPQRYLGEGAKFFTDADLGNHWLPAWPVFGIVQVLS